MIFIKSKQGESLGEMSLGFDISDVQWETITHDGVVVLFYINDDFPVRTTFTNNGRLWSTEAESLDGLIEYLETYYRSINVGMDLMVEVMDKVWFEQIEEEWQRRVSALPI